MERLSEAAAAWGIDSDYVDARGRRQILAPDALALIVDAVAAHATPPRRGLLPPTIVLRHRRALRLDLPDLPHGRPVRWTVHKADKPFVGGDAEAQAFRLPDDLPIGTYRLRLTIPSEQGETRE